MTAEEEEVRAFLEAASRAPLLERGEEALLVRATRRGDESARKRLIESNLRLVVSIAGRYRDSSLPFADLLDAGSEGLIRAVERHDPDAGHRLSTYATWYIRHAITSRIAGGPGA